MMNCLIVDDEEMAVKVIESHISHIDGLEIVGTYYNAIDAFSALQQQPVDILFLDIQMPKMSGLTLLQSLPNKPHVILTTAHRKFALEGYDLDVVDYLLKPIAFDRFLRAIGKVFRLTNQAPVLPIVAPEVNSAPSFFYIKSDRQFIKILLEEVLFMESLRNHIKIVTTNGNFTTLMSISQMEEKLPPQYFLRIHRSYIIALSKVDRFSQTNVCIEDQTIPIGNLYRKEVFQKLSADLI